MKIESVARQQLACLGDASRYRIVSELVGGQACVTELAGRIGLSQSCTTRHLQALVRAGLVTRQREGRRVLFRVRSQDPAVRSLLAWKSQLEGGTAPGAPGPLRGPGRASRNPPLRRAKSKAVARAGEAPAAIGGNRRSDREPAAADAPPADRAPATASPQALDPPPPAKGESESRDESAPRQPEDARMPRLIRPNRNELEDFLL